VVGAHAGLRNDGCAALSGCGGREGAGHLAHRVGGLNGAAVAGLRAGLVSAVLQGVELATKDVDGRLRAVELRAEKRRKQHSYPHRSHEKKNDFAHV
jgi:hypothetical protein